MHHIDARRSLPRATSHPLRMLVAAAAASLLVALSACASDDGGVGDSEISMDQPKVQIVKKDGNIVKRYDIDGDDQADVIETIETYPDPNNEDITKRRLVKKEIDVNADGRIDIVTEYNERGKRAKETVDSDLDGLRNFVSYYDGKHLSRKELFGSNGEKVLATRYYTEGELDRVERDRNDDGKIDYWEYYDDGQLQRIGQDRNADEKIDSWTRATEPKQAATETTTDGPDIGGESGASEQGDSESDDASDSSDDEG